MPINYVRLAPPFLNSAGGRMQEWLPRFPQTGDTPTKWIEVPSQDLYRAEIRCKAADFALWAVRGLLYHYSARCIADRQPCLYT